MGGGWERRYGSAMRELWPKTDPSVDIEWRLATDDRPKPEGRPWVTLVMIASADGAVAVDGLSGGLGGPADHARFVAARRQADGVIVGATTAKAEDYRRTNVPIAIVTASMSPDPAQRLFTGADTDEATARPLLYTTDQAARTRGRAFDGIAEVVALGDSVTPAAVLADLDGRGLRSVVLEGGPTLNSAFLQADLVDEMLLSFAPVVVGGDAHRITNGPTMPEPRRFVVDRVLLADDLVFVRYLRSAASSDASTTNR